jgi:quercetin dioxygenase-like cupin family protein
MFPAGVIHGLVNLSDTELAHLLSAKNVSPEEMEGASFVERRWDM